MSNKRNHNHSKSRRSPNRPKDKLTTKTVYYGASSSTKTAVLSKAEILQKLRADLSQFTYLTTSFSDNDPGIEAYKQWLKLSLQNRQPQLNLDKDLLIINEAGSVRTLIHRPSSISLVIKPTRDIAPDIAASNKLYSKLDAHISLWLQLQKVSEDNLPTANLLKEVLPNPR